MAAFLRVVALLVALGNYYFFLVNAVLYESEGVTLAEAALDPISLVYASAFFVGAILAAEILHRRARPWLEANVLVRYGTLVAGVVLGGLLAGATLTVAGAVLMPPLEGTVDEDGWPGYAVVRILEFLPLVLLYGGVAGLLEGVVLALPLAVVLGLFRGRGRS